MGTPAKDIGKKFSYADYMSWPDDERWEIIDGTAYAMTPAPSVKHQRIAARLVRIFGAFLDGKPCEPFVSPIDVVLDEFNIVQPDLIVVCDKSKITAANIQGAPDLVVEILSPSTGLKDRREKKGLYERFGVREYLLIHPEDETVERYSLAEEKYVRPDIFGWNETIWLASLPNLELRLWEVFGKELPAGETGENRA